MQSAPWTAPTWLPVFQGLLNVKHGEGTREAAAASWTCGGGGRSQVFLL